MKSRCFISPRKFHKTENIKCNKKLIGFNSISWYINKLYNLSISFET